jgi:succinylglutamic semialdehyde dehydrogenase
MTLRQPPRTSRGDFIDGSFVVPSAPDDSIECISPADLDDVIGTWPSAVSHVERAIGSARRAQHAWRRRSPDERAAYLRAYAKAVASHKEDIAVAIARAIGKPLWEARTEVDAMVAKVEITLGAGLDLVKTQTLADGARIRYRPIGVCAVIGPFNFPGHLPNGHIVPALATGNTVVFKPSERAPEVGEWMARCFEEAAFPAGVVNVVQGARAVSEALVAHRDIDAVMFTGSTHVGQAILAKSAQWPGRMLALEMGGKNAAIVTDDADLDGAASEIAFAAYVTAGQRCTGTSIVLASRAIADALVERLAYIARETRIGPPDEPDVFLGPVITASSRERALRAVERMRDRYEMIVAPRELSLSVNGHYLAPTLLALRDASATQRDATDCEELFAPVLTVERVDTDDEAIARANATPYGLAASVYTADESRFDRIADELDVGICNWNRGTVGSSSKLPFGGVKDSGNHRPAGLFSSYYCTDAVAQIRLPKPPSGALSPGFRVK